MSRLRDLPNGHNPYSKRFAVLMGLPSWGNAFPSRHSKSGTGLGRCDMSVTSTPASSQALVSLGALVLTIDLWELPFALTLFVLVNEPNHQPDATRHNTLNVPSIQLLVHFSGPRGELLWHLPLHYSQHDL